MMIIDKKLAEKCCKMILKGLDVKVKCTKIPRSDKYLVKVGGEGFLSDIPIKNKKDYIGILNNVEMQQILYKNLEDTTKKIINTLFCRIKGEI